MLDLQMLEEKEEIPSHLVCPLTLEVMQDPVMSRYGHSFERTAILNWLRSGEGVCPLTRQPLHIGDLVSNHALRVQIDNWQCQNGGPLPAVPKTRHSPEVYGFITIPSKVGLDEVSRALAHHRNRRIAAINQPMPLQSSSSSRPSSIFVLANSANSDGGVSHQHIPRDREHHNSHPATMHRNPPHRVRWNVLNRLKRFTRRTGEDRGVLRSQRHQRRTV